MNKRNLLLVLFLAGMNSSFAQNDSNTDNPTSEPTKLTPNKVQSEKQINVEKSTVNKTVKVDAVKLEKKKAVIEPKEKAKIEEQDNQKKKKVKF